MLRTIGRLAALMAAAFVCTRAVIDPDLWWHLRAGLDLLDTRHLTAVDPYSFTQDVPWINHEWLSESIMALAYRAGGVAGLLAMKVLLLAAAFVLLAGALRYAEEAARWWLLAAGIVAMNFSATTIRPQLWTLLGVALTLRALSWRRGLYWLPLIFAAWSNLHGGWIVGFAAALLWVAGQAIDARSVRRAMPAAAALSAALAATLVNPYGWQLWSFLLATVRVTRNLTEWQPVWRQQDASMFIVWSMVAFGVVGRTLVRRRNGLTWAATLPVAWLAVTSLLVTRLVPIFGEAAVICLAGAWRSPMMRGDQKRTAPTEAPNAGMLVIDAVALAAVCAVNLVGESRCLPISGPWVPDLEAAAAFDAPGVQGRLVLPYDWGGYAIWHWGPRLRVSIDPRRETVYSESAVETASAVRSGRPEGLVFLARAQPDYIWLPASSASTTGSWARANGYRIDFATERSFVASRADVVPLRHPAVRAAGCFP